MDVMNHTLGSSFHTTRAVSASTIDRVPQPLSLLFIGEAGAEAVSAELRRGGYQPTFERISTHEQLASALARTWDIAISDFATGDFGALAALRMIQEQGLDLPLIVVSGRIKDSEALSALKAGAADHLTRSNLMR